MTASLIGGTGLTGSFLVRQLLADSRIKKVISVEYLGAKLTEILVSGLVAVRDSLLGRK
jgi:hypothetical protein